MFGQCWTLRIGERQGGQRHLVLPLDLASMFLWAPRCSIAMVSERLSTQCPAPGKGRMSVVTVIECDFSSAYSNYRYRHKLTWNFRIQSRPKYKRLALVAAEKESNKARTDNQTRHKYAANPSPCSGRLYALSGVSLVALETYNVIRSAARGLATTPHINHFSTGQALSNRDFHDYLSAAVCA